MVVEAAARAVVEKAEVGREAAAAAREAAHSEAEELTVGGSEAAPAVPFFRTHRVVAPRGRRRISHASEIQRSTTGSGGRPRTASNALLGQTTWEPPTEELAEYGRALMAGSRSSTPPSADPDVVIDSQLKPEGNLIAHGTTSQYTWERRGGVLALALLLSALSICSRGEAGMGAQPTCRSRESPRR